MSIHKESSGEPLIAAAKQRAEEELRVNVAEWNIWRARAEAAEAVIADVIDRLDKHTRALHFHLTTPQNVADLVDAICETDSGNARKLAAAEARVLLLEQQVNDEIQAHHKDFMRLQALDAQLKDLAVEVRQIEQHQAITRGWLKRLAGRLEALTPAHVEPPVSPEEP